MIRLLLVMFLVAAAGCSKAPGSDDTSEARVAEPAGSDDGAVARITADAAKKADIEVLQAHPAEIRSTLRLYGVIKNNAEREQTVRARYPGTVRSVTKRPGDRVARDEPLLTIESNDSLEPYTIRSPIAGSVLDRRVNPGETVDSSTTLMTVADLSIVWAEFQVFARDLSRVRAGMPVGIRAGESDVEGEAKLTYVAPAGHADSQSVVARAELDNPDGRWIGGQFVTGDVVVSAVSAPVTVTPDALQTMNQSVVVFVQSDAGFEARKVEIGQRSRDAVEVINGLAAGEKYAGKNSYLIKADLQKGEVEED